MFGSSLRLIPVAAFLFAAFSLAAPYNDYPDPSGWSILFYPLTTPNEMRSNASKL